MRKLKLEELNRLSVEEFKKTEKIPLVVVLDNVRSGLNVGSVFRSSDAFAVEKIYLVGITATPPHKEILKTAIGATNSVDWEYQKEITDVVSTLKKEDYKVFGIEQITDSTPLQDVDFQSFTKAAIVLGNEVSGVSESILPMLDGAIEIPQFGTKHSLNVSVCGGVVIWEFFKKMKKL